MKIAVAGGTGVVGRYAVEAAEAAGHEVVTLSRSTGVDVAAGTGLEQALDGADVVIDALNLMSARGKAVAEFFTTTTRNLQQAGAAAGVHHLVTLSIVGIERVPGYPYYQAKVAQEEAAKAGPLPVSILRATQFHEFPAQMLGVLRLGPITVLPHMRSQTVAARTVGEHLVRLAVERPSATVELAGPEVHDVPALARRILAARGESLRVLAVPFPGRASKQMRSGALLPGPDAVIDGPRFEEWLESEDAKRVPLRR